MDITIKDLNECFEIARESGHEYIAVSIDLGRGAIETIINSKENFDIKQNYYNANYDKFLYHKHADSIRIIGIAFGDTFKEIEDKLLQSEQVEFIKHVYS